MAENNTILIGERSEPSGNAPSGKIYIWSNAGSFYTKDDNGTVRSQVLPDFGQNYSLSIFDDYTMTTSGTTWDTYSGFQCAANKVGKYLVFCHAIIRMSSTSYNAMARLSKNSSAVGSEIAVEMKDSSSNNRNPITFIREVTLAEDDYLDLDFATESSSGTLTVHEAALILWRV